MKKFKLLLLTMLIFVFTLTLGLGTMVAFADEPGEPDYKLLYSNLFTRDDCTVDEDATKGLKFTIDKGGYFNSMYHLSIGEEGEYFISSAEVVVTGITNATAFTELFEIKLVSGATSNQSATDRIRFFYKAASQDSAEAVCVKFNNDTTEYKLNLTTVTPDGTSDKVLVIPNFKLQIVPTTEVKDGVEKYYKKVSLLATTTENENVFVPQQFENPANPEAHKNATALEILQQVNGPIDGFCSGIGTGGTISGIGEVLKEKNPDITIWAVEPENAAILAGGSIGTHLQMGIGDGLIPENLNCEIYSDIFVITDDEAISTAKDLARKEGLLCGISSGTNVAAAIRLAKKLGKGKTVVTVLPDTAERYFSTPLFDKD